MSKSDALPPGAGSPIKVSSGALPNNSFEADDYAAAQFKR